MPDLIDTPNSPNHRSLAHGVIPIGTVALMGKDTIVKVRMWLKDKATAYKNEDDLLMELLCEFCIGALDGFIAGYASHLALDACTPRGLPAVS